MTNTTKFNALLSADLSIDYEIPEPKTERKAMEEDPYLVDTWKNLPESRKEKQFPSKFRPSDITHWRKAVLLTLKFDDKPVVQTDKSQVRHISFSDLQKIMAGENIISLVHSQKIRIANLSEIENPKYPFKKYPWKKWFVFVDNGHFSSDDETVIVAVPDVENENLYGFPETSFKTYQEVLQCVHFEQNKILNKYRDKLSNPAEFAVKQLRERTQMTQEEFAKKAGISKMTLVKAEKGGNVSVDVLMKIATAGGKFLTINFE